MPLSRTSAVPVIVRVPGISCSLVCGTLRRMVAADNRARCTAAEMHSATPIDFPPFLAVPLNLPFPLRRDPASGASA